MIIAREKKAVLPQAIGRNASRAADGSRRVLLGDKTYMPPPSIVDKKVQFIISTLISVLSMHGAVLQYGWIEKQPNKR